MSDCIIIFYCRWNMYVIFFDCVNIFESLFRYQSFRPIGGIHLAAVQSIFTENLKNSRCAFTPSKSSFIFGLPHLSPFESPSVSSVCYPPDSSYRPHTRPSPFARMPVFSARQPFQPAHWATLSASGLLSLANLRAGCAP